jgi:hypothetical protein
MRIALIVALLALAGVRHARASCGAPRTALSPPSGATLPPHPTIYLFDTDDEANIRDSLVITRDDDTTEKFRPTRLAKSADYTVHRIELMVSPRDHAIQVRWKGELLARYAIADDGGVDQAKVVDVTHYVHHWMCSFADVIRVAVEGNAIAYQLEWEDDRTTVVADEHLLWSAAKLGEASVLELGHPDCMSYNVDSELLATPRSFELYALFADGKVQRLGSSVIRLDEHGVRLPVELIRGADVRLPRSFRVAVTTSPNWVFASGAAGGLAGAIVAFALGRRRRRLRLHQSPLAPQAETP